jgi:hypothetical protein
MAPTTTSTFDKKPLTKSDFIRQQAATLSATEVVAKAKAQGIEFSPGLVYEVRRLGKSKKGTAPKKTAAVAKKAPAATNGAAKKPAQSKAEFVRKFPSLSPKDVAAKGKSAGILFDVGYVYNIRSADKASAKKKATTTKAVSKPLPLANVSGRSAPANAETLLKAVAAELGLGQAVLILAAERVRVRAIIGG